MKKFTICLLILTTALLAHGRLVKRWSYKELYDQADLVVIAQHISTTNTTERAVLPNILPDIHVIGLSSEFDIEVVMKGEGISKTLTLHHYKLVPLPPNTILENGPNLASFFNGNENTRYLLFLHRESDGRYAPVSGQTDPARVSILRLDGDIL